MCYIACYSAETESQVTQIKRKRRLFLVPDVALVTDLRNAAHGEKIIDFGSTYFDDRGGRRPKPE